MSIVRSDVSSYLLLDLMLSDSRNACGCSYVRVFFSIVSNLKSIDSVVVIQFSRCLNSVTLVE